MYDQIIRVCLDIIIILGAVNMVFIFFVLIGILGTLSKVNKFISDMHRSFETIKMMITSPFKFIMDFFTKE